MILLLAGCNKDEDNNGKTNTPVTGKASLDLVLAASNDLKSVATYDSVNIHLLQISFHTSDDTNATGGWYDLETIPGIYNLLDFIADDTLVAFDSLLAAQTISQVRLILGDSNTVVENGISYPLSTPSAQTSGLKVQVHCQMVPDSAYVIMLDFDPEQSIHKTGNGVYKLKPVIRAIINP
ncbi:MAG TPA: DUF4382 domain-containing protein [Bacteroidales bacterium]|nr:DUF4382 domain-containing protein [Bacteroidales bacterium]